jgi:hypothetical protein
MAKLIDPLTRWATKDWLSTVGFEWPLLDELRDQHHALVQRYDDSVALVRSIARIADAEDQEIDRAEVEALVKGGNVPERSEVRSRLVDAEAEECSAATALCDHTELAVRELLGHRAEAEDRAARAHPEIVPRTESTGVPLGALLGPTNRAGLDGIYRMVLQRSGAAVLEQVAEVRERVAKHEPAPAGVAS